MAENNQVEGSVTDIAAVGATVSYSLFLLMGRLRTDGELFCPVVDLSSSGVRFLTRKLLKFRSLVELEIAIPGEKIPLTVRGRVVWASVNPGKTYRYQAGVIFDPGLEHGARNQRALLDEKKTVKDEAAGPLQGWLKSGL
mgnify:CR=1 FL=1